MTLKCKWLIILWENFVTIIILMSKILLRVCFNSAPPMTDCHKNMTNNKNVGQVCLSLSFKALGV